MARSADDPRLCFKALYHDELSGLTKEFQLRFFFLDKSVELTDLGTRKCFLKRTGCPQLDTGDFVIGKTVVVFGRLFHLIEYMDNVTRQLCEGVSSAGSGVVVGSLPNNGASEIDNNNTTAKSKGATDDLQCGTCYVFVERSRFFGTMGKALSVLDVELGFTVTAITAGTLPAAAVASAVKELSRNPRLVASTVPLAGGHQHELDTVGSLRALAGKMLCCFRLAKAGCNNIIGEIYHRLVRDGPSSSKGAIASTDRSGLFAVATPNTVSPMEALLEAVAARSANKYLRGLAAVGSVIIIKPHLVMRKAGGDVLQFLLDQTGGELVGLSLVNLSSRDASSMLAAYRGVLPDFQGTTAHLASGASIAVHLCSKRTAAMLATDDEYRDQCVNNNEAVDFGGDDQLASKAIGKGGEHGADDELFFELRALCGPFDPTIARALRSSTIRARYGVDSVLNAVHCCDILEDVAGVCKFIFAMVAVRRLIDPSSECS